MKLTPREIDAIVKHVKAMACRGGWNKAALCISVLGN